jgi:protein-tyrosine phosphatase
MIDTHCHILAGIDDGAMNKDISMLMAQMATADGITRIIATPHIRNDFPTPENIQAATQELNQRLNQWGVPVSIIPGAEVSMMMDLDSMLSYTINNTPYILIEFPHSYLPFHFKDILFQLKIRGYRPIIAHPERHPDIIRQPKILFELHADEVRVQITADSLMGRFGTAVKRCAEYLLKNNVVDIIASDAHSTDDRRPVLSMGLKIAAKIIGKEKAFSLVTKNPLTVIQGDLLPSFAHA